MIDSVPKFLEFFPAEVLGINHVLGGPVITQFRQFSPSIKTIQQNKNPFFMHLKFFRQRNSGFIFYGFDKKRRQSFVIVDIIIFQQIAINRRSCGFIDAKVFRQCLAALNGQALSSPKLRIVNADAFGWLEGSDAFFDVIVIDFPDPTNFSIGKLYTTSFYALVDRHLAADGFAVVQTTSPLVARRSFWTVASTLEAVGLTITPYHAHVPSFGEWGFIVAGRRPFRAPTALPPGLRFLTVEGFAALLQFPPDMARVPMPPNRLSDQSLVHTFEAEWGRVHQ